MSEEPTVRILHRDILLIAALVSCTVGLFFITRAVASQERRLDGRVAATWYQEGQRQLSSGAIEGAIDSFREATANDRDNRTYMLALADALIAANHTAEGQQALDRLRESNPNDAEVNLHLARLAAKTGNIQDAVRYYHGALDGLLTGPQVDERRRQIRVEMIRFLLDHNERNRALSELLVLDADLPNTAASHTQVAELFLEVGDAQHAWNDFYQAIRVDGHDTAAIAGAGEAAFQLGDYEKARRYLEDLAAEGQQSPHVLHLLSIVRTVSSDDPLASHLTMQERRQRLLTDFDYSLRRIEQCPGHMSGDTDLEALKAEALSMRPKLSSSKLLYDPGLLRSALKIIYRIEATTAGCKEATDLDEALLLIGRRHGDLQ